jgi:hypothetical protein
MRLQIDIYEDAATTPVLSHIFYGTNCKAIQNIVTAHQKYDAFFKAAMTTRAFNGMQLRTVQEWLP